MLDKNIIIALLSVSNFGIYNKFLARKLGLVESIILSELISMYQYTINNNIKDDFAQQDEFFFQQQRMADELCMHITTINKYLKSLCNSKILQITKRGIPCKAYYKINFNAIFELLKGEGTVKTSFSDLLKLAFEKCKNRLSENAKTCFSEILKEINNINKQESKQENKQYTPPTPSRGSECVKEETYKEIVDLYNKTCKSLTEAKGLNKIRREKLDKLLDTYTLEDFGKVFKNAEKSNFLKGITSDKGWSADFDWLIREDKFLIVLEGGYQSRAKEEEKKLSYDEIDNNIEDWI